MTADLLANREISQAPQAICGLLSKTVGLACLDRDMGLCSWNAAWTEALGLTGVPDDALSGRDLLQVVPELTPRIDPARVHLLAGECLHLEELTFEGGERPAYWDLLLMPLVERGQVKGFLSLVIDLSERASARERLERSLLSYRRELSALRDVMSTAAESLELKDILRRLLEHVLRVMKSKVGTIHLFDEGRTALTLAAAHGMPRRVITQIDTIPGPFDWVDLSSDEQEPFIVPSFAFSPLDASDHVRRIAGSLRGFVRGRGKGDDVVYVGVPIRSRGEVLGLISVVGPAGREFDEGDVALLRSIGDQTGVVVENARLYRQAEQLAVVRERERLARELHDSVTQSLYSLTLLAEASQRLLGSGEGGRAVEYVERLGEIAQQALKEMRLLVYQLRPLVLKREGLVGALQHRLDAVEKRAGVDARLLVTGSLDLPDSMEEGLYRIAQEALNNALKHAAPNSVTLRIRAQAHRVRLEVEDDGQGFDETTVAGGGGMGLISMRERTERMGGSFSLVSAPGEGTTVRVVVEVPR